MPSGNPNVISSRGMFDPPRNAHEQGDVVPSTVTAKCTRLTPGAAIYVPPGHWHRVVPVEDDPRCLSVDIRVASAAQARWVCEELFAGMMHGLYRGELHRGAEMPDLTMAAAGSGGGVVRTAASQHDPTSARRRTRRLRKTCFESASKVSGLGSQLGVDGLRDFSPLEDGVS